MDDWTLPKPLLALLLEHCAAMEGRRQSWRVMYPLREVLWRVLCGTIADGDDIIDWGEAALKLLTHPARSDRLAVLAGHQAR